MLDQVTLSLLLAGASGVAKAGIGIGQSIKGKKLGKQLGARPQYEIPPAVQEYLNLAKAQAGRTALPGQTIMEEKVGAATSSGIRGLTEGASSSAGLMAGIAGIKGQEQQAIGDIGIKAAEYQDVNRQRLQEALLKYGSEQSKQFEINKLTPYYEKAQAAEAMKGAGMQNIVGGLGEVAGAASIYGSEMGEGGNLKLFKEAKAKGFKGTMREWLQSKKEVSPETMAFLKPTPEITQ